MVLIAQVVELQDSMVGYTTLFALQSLLVLQELLSILLQCVLVTGHYCQKIARLNITNKSKAGYQI